MKKKINNFKIKLLNQNLIKLFYKKIYKDNNNFSNKYKKSYKLLVKNLQKFN